MNQKALKTLEYHKIINMLLQHASSPMGQELCRQLTPSDDLNVVRGSMDEFRRFGCPD